MSNEHNTLEGERSRAGRCRARAARRREKALGAAANVEYMAAAGRDVLEQEGVVVGIVIPPIAREHGQTVKLLPECGC